MMQLLTPQTLMQTALGITKLAGTLYNLKDESNGVADENMWREGQNIDDETVKIASQEVSEKTSNVENQNVKHTWPMTTVDSLQEPPGMPLKEQARH